MANAEGEKVRKAKKSEKQGNEKWSGSLIWNLIDEYEARPCGTFFVITTTIGK